MSTHSVNSIEHSQDSCKQKLENLIDHCEQLRPSLQPVHNPCFTQIDQWEKESIETIHQMADNIREELKLNMQKHSDQFTQKFDALYEQINRANKNDNFLEINLNELTTKLDKLQSFAESLPIVNIEKEKLISKLSIFTLPDDIFENFAGDLQIENHGQVVVHGPSVAHAAVRGSGEYSTGVHRFRFQIESYNINEWIFFGIISHHTTLLSNTWAIPSCYGWGGQNSTMLNRVMHSGLNGYKCDFQLNDTIELKLDCDNRIIFLTNERTKLTNQMHIDLIKCPFPWHFFLNIFYPNDRVRILHNLSNK